jgi:hypothetical protein
MKNRNKLSEKRYSEICLKVESIITNNRKEVGNGNSIQEIEEGLLSSLLDFGRLLLKDRVIEEESKLEKEGYEIESKKKESREFNSSVRKPIWGI